VAEREVLRLHIRSTIRDDAAHDRATVWCLENSYSGLGWGIWDHEGLAGISWSEYEEHGRANSNVRRFHDAAVGTLLWTRQRNGNYWLGVVEGEWEYRDEQQARDLDLFNVRPTRWEQVGTEGKVPGRVVNAFRSRWTLQKIHDDAAREYTRRLHEKLFEGRSDFEPADAETVIKSLLGPEDLEDLVAVYLQDRYAYLVVSRLRSTPGYEYELRTRDGGDTAVASVKSGETHVDLDLLPSDTVDASYGYAVCEKYDGQRHDRFTEIKTDELAEFMRSRREVLPERVVAWLGREEAVS
jgi:hypothetical protein